MLATVAVNCAVVAPELTVTLAGTVILALLLDNETVDPPEGAAAVNVTVQVEVPGAFTVPREQLRLDGCTGGFKVSAAVWVTPPPTPVIVAL